MVHRDNFSFYSMALQEEKVLEGEGQGRRKILRWEK
jgi:hypothetical protein